MNYVAGEEDRTQGNDSPLPPIALCQYSQHPFHRAKHCSVNKDRTLQGTCLPWKEKGSERNGGRATS